jgi:signal transduction histidine kinase
MGKPLRVLLLEDSEDDAELLLAELQQSAYQPLYKRIETADGLRDALSAAKWDVIISDYSMPNFDAPAALRIVRQTAGDIPFIIVSGVIGEESAVAAMKAGAHDYLMKGKLARLAPAIERELREAAERRARRDAEQENANNLQRIRALHEIEKAINSTLNLEAVLALLLDNIELFIPFSAATTIRLFNRTSGQFENTACRNVDEMEWKKERRGNMGQLSREITHSKNLVLIPDVQADREERVSEFFRKHGFASYLGVPLLAKDGIVGILGFYTREKHEFTQQETDFLLTLAGQAAIAIHNSQLYQQTAEQAVELKRANQVKDQFLSIISHELRTPLNLIMGYATAIKDGVFGDSNKEQQSSLEKVLRHSKDLLGLITNILHATRIEGNDVQVQSQRFSLRDLFAELKEISDHAPETVTVVWDCPQAPDVGSDRDKLRVILHNLIDNAIKFTQSGEVRISAKIENLSSNGNRSGLESGHLELTVEDTGPGIEENKLPFIFDLFRQGDSSETRVYGGLGLGLYTSKRFVELLRGILDVETSVGKGSTFRVNVPCKIIGSTNIDAKSRLFA